MTARRRQEGKPYHHGDLRRALLDETLALAADRGAGGVTLREAARAAGVSQTAPYRHFSDKQAMLAAASEEGFRLFYRELQQALSRAGRDPKKRLLSLGEAYVRFALEHSPHFRLMFGHGSPPKSASPGLQAAANQAFRVFYDAVESGFASRSGAAAVKGNMFRLWALVHGVASLALERQVLFDVPMGALAQATRDAMADLVTTSRGGRRLITRS